MCAQHESRMLALLCNKRDPITDDGNALLGLLWAVGLSAPFWLAAWAAVVGRTQGLQVIG